MICPNCGKETAGKFCKYCGASLPASAEQPAVDPQAYMGQTVPLDQLANPNPYGQAGETVVLNQDPMSPPDAANAYQAPYGAQGSYGAPDSGYSAQGAPYQAPGAYQQQNVYAPAAFPGAGYQAQDQGRAAAAVPSAPSAEPIRAVRRMSTSILYILSTICVTASFGIIVWMLLSQMDGMFSPNGISAMMPGGGVDLTGVRNIMLIFFGIVLLPPFLMVLGLWIHLIAASRKSTRMSTAGLTMIKVYLIILQIVCAIAVVGLLIVMLQLLASVSHALVDTNYQLGELGPYASQVLSMFGDIKTAIIVMLAVTVIIYILAVCFLGGATKTINTVKYTIRSGAPSKRVSVFTAVICIIGGILGLLLTALGYAAQSMAASELSALLESLSGSLGTQISFTGQGATIAFVSALCSALASLLFGILILRYRSAMNKLLVYDPQQPAR